MDAEFSICAVTRAVSFLHDFLLAPAALATGSSCRMRVERFSMASGRDALGRLRVY